jgi:hypothetical protein
LKYKFLERYKEFYDRLGIDYIVYNGLIWRNYQKMIIPSGPVKLNYKITEEEAKYLLSQFKNALMIRVTYGFNLENNYKREWYAVIADKFYPLETYSSKNRNKIKKGLKNTEIKRIDAKYLAENGYDVFISAFNRYQNAKIPNISEKDFKKQKLLLKDFEDIIHIWGVFYKGKLVAYSENAIYGNVEASYGMTKFHPDFLKFRISCALFYTMNKYYLENHLVEYVSDGFRNILHQTNIQKFLIEKFGFKKVYLNLDIYYKPFVKLIVNSLYPFKSLVSKFNPKIEALLKLEEIRRKG